MSRWSRRHVLRAAGASLLLPFLPSLLPRSARADETPPVRLLFWYVPNGMHMADWTPSRDGADYDLPYILEPLAPVQRHVSVLTGLDNMAGRFPRPGDHARGTGCFLTCVTPRYTGDASVENGVSIDQVVAGQIGEQTPFPSLQLGLDGGATSGQCDSGYPCTYQNAISWTDAYTPLPKVTNPRLVFDRLFGGTGTDDPVVAARRRALELSILDAVSEDARALQTRLSTSDRRKLDQYLTGVREVEKRLEGLGGGACTPPERPEGRVDVPTRSTLMNELMAVAFECDVTRVISYMFANGGSGRNHTWLPGAGGNHHGISHHQGQQSNYDKLRIINRWEVSQLVDFLQRLETRTDTDGTSLLDNTLVVMSSEIADGNRHNHDDLPVLLAGGGGGAHRPGRHLRFGTRSLADLYTSMARAAGASVDRFGMNGTGPLPEIG